MGFFTRNNHKKILVFLLILVLVSLPVPRAGAANPSGGVLLFDDNGKILVSQNENIPYIPASTLKLMTSLAAIHHFGSDFHFTMPAVYDSASNNLYIRGLGDPLFISEVIRDFTVNLIKNTQIKDNKKINDIILDLSFFEKNIDIPGTGTSLNPYDATTGALCANFNTIAFQWDPGKAVFKSDEPQTPLLDIFIKDIQETGLKRGRILLDPDHRMRYPGLLVKFFLREQGIQVRGKIKLGKIPFGTNQPYVYESPFSMNQIIEKLLKFSNNFIANQLVLTMGARAYGEPADLEKGVKVLRNFAVQELGLKGFRLAEGSGLSRQNRLTSVQMIHILNAFKPYHKLMPENQDEYYKTGTLSDVRCRAGYIKGGRNRLFPYIIMINEKNKRWEPVLRELIRKVRSIK